MKLKEEIDGIIYKSKLNKPYMTTAILSLLATRIRGMKQKESILIGDAYSDEIYEKENDFNKALEAVLQEVKGKPTDR